MSNDEEEKLFELFCSKKDYSSICRLLNNLMAGDESLKWHRLIADFILVGQKLEQLGSIYCNGRVTIL
jgi:hypothetical protein